jgi:single-stranded DNA-specific DHH superfamily exonuclease
MHHDASRDAPPTLIIKPHAKDKNGGQPKLCFAGISWRHVRQGSMEVTQSKTIKWRDQSSKKKSGREDLGGATPWSTRSQSNKGAWSALEKVEAERGGEDPRTAGLASF